MIRKFEKCRSAAIGKRIQGRELYDPLIGLITKPGLINQIEKSIVIHGSNTTRLAGVSLHVY